MPRRLLVLAGVAALVVLVLAAVAVRQAGPRLRAKVVQTLEQNMEASVTLDRFDVRLRPWPSVSGGGLVLKHRSRPDLPPLISVQSFSGDIGWRSLLLARLDHVTLDGLEVTVPPRRRADFPALTPRSSGGEAAKPGVPALGISRITAGNTRLTILPRNPAKDPLVFDIHALEMRHVTTRTPWDFTASITNPIPTGRVDVIGSFGPWDGDEPAATPIEGQFEFDADLGSIKGIAGALHSSGAFDGAIDRIEAHGTTDTPDFRIPKLKAAALPLATTYSAVIDGTNGDVRLDKVDARLAASRFVASGSVFGTKGVKGKRILLDVTATDARMEDVLRLTVGSAAPAMTGRLALETSFDLPQGDRDVLDKLRLDGQVTITRARFTSDGVQGKVDALSRRARGRPGDEAIENVSSDIRSRFTMANGSVQLTNLTYDVEGAQVAMSGHYALAGQTLDFAGTVRLHATLSQTQTGFRHFVLKPFDGLFRKGGAGTRLAITVTGTLDAPDVGLALGRTLKGQ